MLRFIKRLRTYRSSIHFVYAEQYRYFGTTVLRGEQLSKIAEKALGQKIYFTSTDYRYKNCTLFLTKRAIEVLSHEGLKRLKDNQNRLIFDPVDWIMGEGWLGHADILIAISQEMFEMYKKKLPSSQKIVLVNHNVDSRLKKLDWSELPTKLSVGYFGELRSTFLTSKIEQLVDVFPVDNGRQNDYWMKQLPNYNLHYAIRQKYEVYPIKPFIKGFTAAHCDANILIQDSEKEAVRWLGKDYPYLLRGKVTEKKILEMLKYAKKSFGSKEWNRGLEIMDGVREKTSEEAIGKQLVELFAEVDRGGWV